MRPHPEVRVSSSLPPSRFPPALYQQFQLFLRRLAVEKEGQQFHHIIVGQQGRFPDEGLQHTAAGAEAMRPLCSCQPRHLMGEGVCPVCRSWVTPPIYKMFCLLSPCLSRFVPARSSPRRIVPVGALRAFPSWRHYLRGHIYSRTVIHISRFPTADLPADDFILAKILAFPEGQEGHLCLCN